MIRLELTETYGWEAAIRGMRNPMNSWDKSDSCICSFDLDELCHMVANGGKAACELEDMPYCVGKNDLALMKRLAKAGSDHRKYMRQIFVSVDITASLYWWKEFDTYKVGTVANSTSTMHKIHAKPFEAEDFSTDQLTPFGKEALDLIVEFLENSRQCFNKSGDKNIWYDIISILPSGYLQRRTVTMNYEVLLNMYHARKNHKLYEWHEFCDWIKSLPYSEIITGDKIK